MEVAEDTNKSEVTPLQWQGRAEEVNWGRALLFTSLVWMCLLVSVCVCVYILAGPHNSVWGLSGLGHMGLECKSEKKTLSF